MTRNSNKGKFNSLPHHRIAVTQQNHKVNEFMNITPKPKAVTLVKLHNIGSRCLEKGLVGLRTQTQKKTPFLFFERKGP